MSKMGKEFDLGEDFNFDDEVEESKFKRVKTKVDKSDREKTEKDMGNFRINDEKKTVKVEKTQTIQRIEDANGLDFSDEQVEIITHTGSPLGVIACAGSGKTTVLVSKMIYREIEYKVKPLNMLAITFSADAVYDMKKKYRTLRKEVGIKKRGNAMFKTFHALFLMLLQSIDEYKDVKVDGGNKYKYLLGKYVEGVEEDDRMSVLDQMFSYRGSLINKGISKDGIENAEVLKGENNNTFNMENYKDIMKKYQEYKQLDGVIDFDDMQTLLYAEMVGKDNAEPVKAFQRVWGDGDVYIDEYQDISKIQRDIMDKLIKDFNRKTIIGDDDQSIYRFRGSDPKYILDFQHTYSKAEIKYLSENYRCRENILNEVIPMIETNKHRMDKSIRASKTGGNIEYIKTRGNIEPLITELLSELSGLDQGFYDDIAILVRNNSQRMLITDELIEQDVPVNIHNEKFSLQENKVYNTLLDIVEMIKQEDNALFIKHYKKLFPHLNKQAVNHYLYSEDSWYLDVTEQGMYNIRAEDFKRVQQIYETNNMYNALVHVWMLIKKYYKGLSDRGYGSYTRTEEIVKYMLKISKGYTMNDFLDSEENKYSRIRMWCGSDEALKVRTIHSVKGLEFGSVYIVGVNGDVIPDIRRYERLSNVHGYKSADRYMEEERRLLYVAWTRAKHRLVVSYDPKNPSVFLEELQGSEKE